jgi:hypothetical protein
MLNVISRRGPTTPKSLILDHNLNQLAEGAGFEPAIRF